MEHLGILYILYLTPIFPPVYSATGDSIWGGVAAGWEGRGVAAGWGGRGITAGWGGRGVTAGWGGRGVTSGWGGRGVTAGQEGLTTGAVMTNEERLQRLLLTKTQDFSCELVNGASVNGELGFISVRLIGRVTHKQLQVIHA